VDPDRITLATIALAVTIKGVVLLATNRQTYALPAFTEGGPVHIAGAAANTQMFWNLGLVVLSAGVLTLFFRRSRQGVLMRAAADDREMITALGVPASRPTAWAFVIAAVLAAIAGAALTPLTLISYDSGTLLGLKGFAAAMLGGLGSMYGAVVGGFALGIAEVFVAGYISGAYADTLAFLVLLVVLFVRPTGIVRRVAVKRV
jgi:branched-chain amino acid transport system permease protein